MFTGNESHTLTLRSCAVDDEWLCYTTVWEGLLSNKAKRVCSFTPSLSFLVEKATSPYQLVTSDDDWPIHRLYSLSARRLTSYVLRLLAASQSLASARSY
jgi:hypothetical protein